MFTGIISALGTVVGREEGDKLVRLRIKAQMDAKTIALGASIACNGVCLTVVACEDDRGDAVFTVDMAAETLAVTSANGWRVGTRLNLERALRMGDELGGHLVSGHVDGLALLKSVNSEGAGYRLWLEAPASLARFVAVKGSVALDGVSLTVNQVDGCCFSVLIIPHTWQVTILSELKAGDMLHLEIDVMARYIARLREAEAYDA